MPKRSEERGAFDGQFHGCASARTFVAVLVRTVPEIAENRPTDASGRLAQTRILGARCAPGITDWTPFRADAGSAS
jgi:hypothetical protein